MQLKVVQVHQRLTANVYLHNFLYEFHIVHTDPSRYHCGVWVPICLPWRNQKTPTPNQFYSLLLVHFFLGPKMKCSLTDKIMSVMHDRESVSKDKSSLCLLPESKEVGFQLHEQCRPQQWGWIIVEFIRTFLHAHAMFVQGLLKKTSPIN